MKLTITPQQAHDLSDALGHSWEHFQDRLEANPDGAFAKFWEEKLARIEDLQRMIDTIVEQEEEEAELDFLGDEILGYAEDDMNIPYFEENPLEGFPELRDSLGGIVMDGVLHRTYTKGENHE